MFRSFTPRFLERCFTFMRPRGDSLRLIFEYDENGIRLVRRARRGKPAPVGDIADRPVAADKIFLEVRSKDGRASFRRILRDPIPQTTEVFEPDGKITRVPVRQPRGVFTTVIPSDRRADHLVILAGPAVELAEPGFALAPEARGRTREIFRTSLKGR